MRTRVLDEQADLFEISILEQTAEVVPGSLEEIGADPEAPVVLIGKALSPERVADFRALAARVFASGRCLLLLPPYGDLDIGRYLDTPVGMRLTRRQATATVRVVDPATRDEVGDEAVVRSDHIIETSLGAGMIATDDAGRAVALRFQPRNTSGAAVVTTLQLLSYSALSNEEDRQTLLSSLLAWRNESAAGLGEELPGRVRKEEVDPGHVATLLVALGASGITDGSRLRDVASTYLQLDLDASQAEAVLSRLETESVLTLDAEGQRVIVRDALDDVLERLGLHAYSRELREVLRDASSEVRP